MQVKIFHNPRCSKSRKTLELIRERGIEPQIVEYLEHPPTVDELDALLELLGKQPSELMRKKEPAFTDAGLDAEGLSRREQIARMVAHPGVIERPVVVAGDRAIVGRPPENVLEIID